MIGDIEKWIRQLFWSMADFIESERAIYGEKEQQRRIELLLAWSAELLCEPEKAALYYENLLLYDAEYPVAYGEYGMFLIRTGQKEASRKLWEDYKEKEKAELLDDSESRNLQLWEEINEKKKRK